MRNRGTSVWFSNLPLDWAPNGRWHENRVGVFQEATPTKVKISKWILSGQTQPALEGKLFRGVFRGGKSGTWPIKRLEIPRDARRADDAGKFRALLS